MRKLFLLIMLQIISYYLFAQTDFTQTIRGKVIDFQNDLPLTGASVILTNFEPKLGTISDNNGEFRFENVPIGRHNLMVLYVGYNPVTINNLLLSSGKEIVLEIKMEELVIETEEVVVKAHARKDQPINEMSVVSARSFTIEETERYAGSLGDPAKMASNFAGVMTTSDQRNDIVIRGNSPSGLLWRLEGIDVPNPNHFAASGSTGGPVSMLNNNVLANSDFLTSAFPAEYGNAISGVFDLQMRPGNNQKHEFMGQVGFNGFELGAEGPISKKNRSSYLINARYSTMEVMALLGIPMGTGTAIPEYKDVTFKVNLPGKNNHISIFGLGGISYIEMLDSKDASYGFGGTDIYFGTDMGVGGINYTHYFADRSKIKFFLASSISKNKTDMDSVLKKNNQTDSIKPYSRANFTEAKYHFGTEYSKKFNSKNHLKIGAQIATYQMDYFQKYLDTDTQQFRESFNYEGYLSLMQAFAQFNHKFSDVLSIISGIHYQHVTINKSWAFEPRVGLKWKFKNNQSLSIGGGLHSQIQTLGIYFMEDVEDYGTYKTNKNLDMNKSIHGAIGYDYLVTPTFRIKLETYYQYLYNIPVSHLTPEFSALNSGDNFYFIASDSMVNKGKGTNYGIEITTEKFLNKGFYFLSTISIFSSTYEGYDKKVRNSAFDGNYVTNLLLGYEFKIGKSKMLSFDLKGCYAGGKRYIPIDREESIRSNSTEFDWSNAYKDRFDDFFRIDFRIGLKLNGKRINQEFGLDLQNITNHKNVYGQSWDNTNQKIETTYQTGFMPMMLYRIQF